MTNTADQWERMLDPDVVRASLFLATMFITAFEILKDSILDDVRGFYTNGFDENGPTVGHEYQSEVLAKNRSLLYASLQWLRENDAISDEDLITFEKLKITRNQLAHKLFAVVIGQAESAHEAQFADLITLLSKIGKWWGNPPNRPKAPEVEFSTKEFLHEEVKIYRQPDHGCAQTG